MGKEINFKVLEKSGNRSKKAEMDQKFEEIDQQIEIFKVLEKSGNGSNYTLVKFFKNK